MSDGIDEVKLAADNVRIAEMKLADAIERVLVGRTVVVERGRTKFFADVLRSAQDRVQIINLGTNRKYWIYASNVTHLVK